MPSKFDRNKKPGASILKKGDPAQIKNARVKFVGDTPDPVSHEQFIAHRVVEQARQPRAAKVRTVLYVGGSLVLAGHLAAALTAYISVTK